jgi:hypothetical protein
MRAARIYGPADLIGGKINHLQVQACHGPAKGCLLGGGQRRHTFPTQPGLGRACGRGHRGDLRRSPGIRPEQKGRYLGRRSAVNGRWTHEELPCRSCLRNFFLSFLGRRDRSLPVQSTTVGLRCAAHLPECMSRWTGTAGQHATVWISNPDDGDAQRIRDSMLWTLGAC